MKYLSKIKSYSPLSKLLIVFGLWCSLLGGTAQAELAANQIYSTGASYKITDLVSDLTNSPKLFRAGTSVSPPFSSLLTNLTITSATATNCSKGSISTIASLAIGASETITVSANAP